MSDGDMFGSLQKINKKPKPYEFYTAEALWNDPHISKKMLELHLDPKAELASRNKAFIENSVEWIASRFEINTHTKICDFGCGPGLYTTRFAERGARVTGLDFSENSIAYAQKIASEKELDIDYVLKDYLHYSSDKHFDLITLIYCDFCVLSDEKRKALLEKFYDLLEDDGAVLLDVSSLVRFDQATEKAVYECSSNKDFWSNFWSENRYYVFSNTYKYEDHHLLLDKYTIIEENRMREVFNWIKCYSVESLTKELEQSGFRVVEHYSDVSGSPYKSDSSEIAIVATKKE